MPVETEIKLRIDGHVDEIRARIEQLGYCVHEERTLEVDQLFDRLPPVLRAADQLLRLRRSGAKTTVTYKGPAARARYKSREEIEFDVSDPLAFQQVLDRLGYVPAFRYEKFRTKFTRKADMNGSGIITIDETPIGVFLELEGPAEWIDPTANQLGFSPDNYLAVSYSSLYREYNRLHPGSPENMVFNPAERPNTSEK